MRSADDSSGRSGRWGRRALAVLLILPAAALAVLMFEEWRLDVQSQRQYSVRTVSGPNALRLGATTVTVNIAMDAARGTGGEPPVAIRVDGRPAAADIPGHVATYLVERRSDGWRRLVVAQDVSGRLGHAGERPGTVSRLLWIDERGQVVEELVRDADWFRSPLSTRVMRYVIPHDLGYRSNVMSFGWTPPIPQVTAGLCFIGAAMLLRGRRRAGAHG